MTHNSPTLDIGAAAIASGTLLRPVNMEAGLPSANFSAHAEKNGYKKSLLVGVILEEKIRAETKILAYKMLITIVLSTLLLCDPRLL